MRLHSHKKGAAFWKSAQAPKVTISINETSFALGWASYDTSIQISENQGDKVYVLEVDTTEDCKLLMSHLGKLLHALGEKEELEERLKKLRERDKV